MVDYTQLLSRFQQSRLTYQPAELHGMLCGVLAAAPASSEAVVLARLATYVGVENWPATLVSEWRQLHTQVLQAYQGEEMALRLLLPDESVARVAALAAWCEGFLAGFGDLTASQLPHQHQPALSASVTEGLNDLMAIRQVDIPEQMDEDASHDLLQLEEHCRMVAMTLFTDVALQAN